HLRNAIAPLQTGANVDVHIAIHGASGQKATVVTEFKEYAIDISYELVFTIMEHKFSVPNSKCAEVVSSGAYLFQLILVVVDAPFGNVRRKCIGQRNWIQYQK